MGDHIIGVKKLHEISGTVKGANEHCTKLFHKSFGNGGQPQGDPAPNPTESEMDMKITKALLGLDEAGRTYALGLEDDKLKAFMEQSPEDRTAEVTKHVEAEKAKADAAAEDEKAKNAKDPQIVALEDKVKSLEAAATAEKTKARDLELKDIAKSQYGAVPNALTVLKSIEGLDDAARQPILDTLKSQQEMAKSLGVTVGEDDAAEGNAVAQYEAKVDEVAKEKNVTKAAARVLIAEDPANAQLIAAHRAQLAG